MAGCEAASLWVLRLRQRRPLLLLCLLCLLHVLRLRLLRLPLPCRLLLPLLRTLPMVQPGTKEAQAVFTAAAQDGVASIGVPQHLCRQTGMRG